MMHPKKAVNSGLLFLLMNCICSASKIILIRGGQQFDLQRVRS